MSGPKRNPDKLNTIGVVVVGICGAVMVYVSIIALQAFYMNDTSEMQHTKDYAGLERTAVGHKANEMANINQAGTNTGASTFHIPVEKAIELVVEDAKKDPSHLIPALPASTKPTIEPVFGRPKPLSTAPAPEAGQGSGAGSAAAPAQGSGAGSAAPAGTTPTNPAGAAGASAPQTPTGAGAGGAGASPSKDAATPTGTGSASKPK
jgi:hypothetical protein